MSCFYSQFGQVLRPLISNQRGYKFWHNDLAVCLLWLESLCSDASFDAVNCVVMGYTLAVCLLWLESLLTMHGHVRPIGGLGPPWLTVLPEGSMCLLGEAEASWGIGRFWWRRRGSGEAEKCRLRRWSCPRPLRKALVGWSLSLVPQVTDVLCTLSVSWLYWAPTIGL
jgi:hypothetical protein